MALTNAEKQKRYRERLKRNQEKYEEAKRKHRERYHKTKRLVKDLTPKEKFNANLIWRLRKRDLKIRKQNLTRCLEHTPPDSPPPDSTNCELNIPHKLPLPMSLSATPPLTTSPPASPQLGTFESAIPPLVSIPRLTAKARGRKKVKKDRSNVYRENKKLLRENEKLKRKYEKYKKRYFREHKKKSTDNNDPRYKVLSGAIKKTFKNTTSRKARHIIKKIFMASQIEQSRMKKQLLLDSLGVDKVVKQRYSVGRQTVLRAKIKDFLLRDDISRASAGKKETKTRNKVKIQKRYLLDSMKNIYKTFKKENPQLKCSYFYFTKNKPFFIVKPTVDARDMCMCKTHVNFAYKASVLKKKGITDTDDPNILIMSTVCDPNSKACMYGCCDKCHNNKMNYNSEKITGTVRWTEWIRKEEKYEKDGKIMKTVKNIKQEMSGNSEDFIKRYEKDLIGMKKHVFNIKSQFKNFRRCLEELQPNECLIIADFSENYNCKYNQEIQSHHFGGSRKQISLHTVVVYTQDENNPVGHTAYSFCSVSASNNHQPPAIWSHLDPILKWIRFEFPVIDTVHFYSDGPSTQYRQKQNFYLMSTKTFDYGFEAMTWSFFEAGHGKGPADGVGGFLKRTADDIVAKGEDIADVFQFYEKLKNTSKIKLYVIDEKAIQELQKSLPNVPRLVGTLKVHQVFTNSPGVLRFRDLSCFCEKGISGKRGFCMCLEPKIYDARNACETRDKDFNNRVNTTLTAVVTNASSKSKTTEVANYSSDDDKPLISLKRTPELRDVTNTGKRIYEIVYGNSSDDEQPCTSFGKENSKITVGEFLLVNVYVDSLKKKAYRYACKTLTDVEDDGEIKVMFLRVADKDAKRFRIDENDICYVEYDDIIQRLPNPVIIKRGCRIYYQFQESLNIFEK